MVPLGDAWFLPFSVLRTHLSQGAFGQNSMLCDSQNGNVAFYANDIFFSELPLKRPKAICTTSDLAKPRQPVCEGETRKTGTSVVPGSSWPEALYTLGTHRVFLFYAALGGNAGFPNLKRILEVKVKYKG